MKLETCGVSLCGTCRGLQEASRFRVCGGNCRRFRCHSLCEGSVTRGAMTLSVGRQATEAAQRAGGGSPQGLGWLCRGGVGQGGSVAHFQLCWI